jgi:hypothetical protein
VSGVSDRLVPRLYRRTEGGGGLAKTGPRRRACRRSDSLALQWIAQSVKDRDNSTESGVARSFCAASTAPSEIQQFTESTCRCPRSNCRGEVVGGVTHSLVEIVMGLSRRDAWKRGWSFVLTQALTRARNLPRAPSNAPTKKAPCRAFKKSG